MSQLYGFIRLVYINVCLDNMQMLNASQGTKLKKGIAFYGCTLQ